MEITYTTIKALIKKEELMYGNQIHLEFCAKNQETGTQTVAVIMAEQGEIKKNVTKQVIRSTVKNTIINQLFNLIGKLPDAKILENRQNVRQSGGWQGQTYPMQPFGKGRFQAIQAVW